jgi:putative hydrolase of HD superfamily
MAMLHDVAEAITGDIAPADNVPAEEKQRRESAALATLTAKMGGFSRAGSAAIAALVHEYETRESAEAIAVKDLDRLEMVVQVTTSIPQS